MNRWTQDPRVAARRNGDRDRTRVVASPGSATDTARTGHRRGAMQESRYQQPLFGYSEAPPRPAMQQFTRSLEECQDRISALRAKLDAFPPTGRPHTEWGPSALAGPLGSPQAPWPEDRPAVDASLTAIGDAARRLLHDLEEPTGRGGATDRVGNAGGRSTPRMGSPGREVRDLDG
jgi:hypothetical protein